MLKASQQEFEKLLLEILGLGRCTVAGLVVTRNRRVETPTTDCSARQSLKSLMPMKEDSKLVRP